MHGGVVWSPDGVDKEGFALKVMFGGGNYRYISGALNNTEVSGRLLAATILPGYRFVRDKFIATIYGGLDMQNHRLSPDDPSAGLRGSYVGFRVNAELWYEPTPSTMIAADGMISTIDTTYNARFAFGWKIFDRYYLGPEVQGFAAGDNYRQFRVGAHVTGLKYKWFEWSGFAGLGNRQRQPRRSLRQAWTADADVARTQSSVRRKRDTAMIMGDAQPLESQIQARITQSLPPCL